MPGGIHIVLPGLLDLPRSEVSSHFLETGVPNLNRLLTQATLRQTQTRSIDAMIRSVLMPATESEEAFSSLPLAQAFEDPAGKVAERLMLFQAVHLRADLQSAIIVPIEKNHQNLQDIDNIINDLYDLFKVDCYITAIASGLYLMRLEQFDAPRHYPHPLSVLGKPANPYTDQTRLHLPWYKLLNEMQMFMHQHPVNQARMQRNTMTLNSLWFWGAGRRPTSVDMNMEWYCDDYVLNRFAASLGLPVKSLQSLHQIDAIDNAVVIELRLMEIMKTGDETAIDRILLEIDQALGHLMRFAESNRRTLLLRTGSGLDFELRPWSRFRFWRRGKPLDDWLKSDSTS